MFLSMVLMPSGYCSNSPTYKHIYMYREKHILLIIQVSFRVATKVVVMEATIKIAPLIFNIILLAIGNCGGPLLARLYFLHGGKRVWFSSWLQSAGFPILLLPITIVYMHRRRRHIKSPISPATTKFFFMKPRVFMGVAVIGIISGLDNYLFAFGIARLPVSTASLIIATQLAFTATFAFFLVKQKFTPYSINAVVLLTIGAGVLAMHTGSDRPVKESKKEYVMGFVLTLVASVLYGLMMPLVELAYKKAKQEISYALVMEFQMVLCLFATVFCTVGMLINNDFQGIRREAREFELGESSYYVLALGTAIVWQCFFLGGVGIIFSASSLLLGIIVSVSLPITEILAVICYHENFQAEKGVSLGICLWGFISYFYGETRANKQIEKQADEEKEMPPALDA